MNRDHLDIPAFNAAMDSNREAVVGDEDHSSLSVETNVVKIDDVEFKAAREKLIAMLIESKKKLEAALAERQEAQNALTRTVLESNAMINAVPAAMYLKDAEARYVMVNDAFCHQIGLSRGDIIGRTDSEINNEESPAKVTTKADPACLNDGKSLLNHEEMITDASDEQKWMSISKVPIKDANGRIAGLVSFAQDITEQHRSKEQLLQSDKLAAIGTLAAGVAHEINNPIGYIKSNLNTMQKYLAKMRKYIEGLPVDDADEFESLKEMMDDFADAAEESIEGTNRVKSIVTDLKSFSRVDRAEKEFSDINEGIKSTLNVVWNELKYKAEVAKDLGDIPEIFCIPNQLNQVFMNILVNAAHAIQGEKGLIKIKTWADPRHVFISIKDNGCGIPENKVKKIFEPFFTTKEVGKGTGLGLSLTYDIIKKHNGHIDVKSKVGVGTEFIITLPLGGITDE